MSDKVELKHIANNAYQRKIMGKVVSIVLLAIVGVLFLVFTVGQLSESNGLFEITTYTQGKGALSLSQSADFANPTTNITARSAKGMTNISGERDLPADIDSIDGEHNGENYFAYTFYLRNTGDAIATVQSKVNIGDRFRNAEKAMWLRMYVDGAQTTYAHARDDGMAEFGTTAFESDTCVVSKTFDLEKDQTIKYTIVIWVEGDDPDCVDDIMGGFVRFSMDFTIVDENANT